MARPVYVIALFCLSVAPAAFGRVDLRNPRNEAQYLSLEVSGQLRPPVALADQIEADLAAIRLTEPGMYNIHVFPSWMPGELIVGMTPTAYEDFKAGAFDGFDSLYSELGTPQSRTHDFGKVVFLDFGQVYHGSRLAELFQPVDGVRYAEPNGTIGDGNDIIARANRTYTFSRGWGDCPAGCIYRESFDFTVTDDGVFSGTLVPQPGDPGDFNHDGSVDAADYVVWRRGAGSVYSDTHYAGWRSNFGATPATGAFAGASIPEPSGLMLLTLGVAMLLPHRKR